ncbi:Sua5/YciO/YrdC/YwlC family protein [Candidatus Nitrosarchaeum limnium SFB1]|jgi:L-threonylcarbamoyladenylate synthase|uniref:Threonylcarbamoyl-AMP synthase n=1 Tax=Candidatus Nitrosarchaeum limnium SFB1 TaxID=886738 RepID=F3KLK0_9ARCH|nr:Sua5/YciO/YrdC/YwlC family protein [Candidatus Nitrosarchaeum limnium SFB1]
MKTRVIIVNPKKPQIKKIDQCVSILRKGGLVAFPTETVYGLGADGLNPKAIKKIFQAKNRPSDNPLIFHISNKKDVKKYTKDIPATAEKLIEKFWPGPLTLILKKSSIIPKIATGGLNTIAIRMPSHKIALSLINSLGNPIVAPSANLFGKPSPTLAKHVLYDLDGKIDAVIDGRNSVIGIESTILDLTTKTPTILRPGKISYEELKNLLKKVKYHPSLLGKKSKLLKVKSPGMKYKHYSPNAKIILVEGNTKNTQKKIHELIKKFQQQKKLIGIINNKNIKKIPFVKFKFIGTTKNLIASNLYKSFRELDDQKVDVIIMREVDTSNLGFAIMNRLRKAASEIISA